MDVSDVCAKAENLYLDCRKTNGRLVRFRKLSIKYGKYSTLFYPFYTGEPPY